MLLESQSLSEVILSTNESFLVATTKSHHTNIYVYQQTIATAIDKSMYDFSLDEEHCLH